jgi:hypothetical protein
MSAVSIMGGGWPSARPPHDIVDKFRKILRTQLVDDWQGGTGARAWKPLRRTKVAYLMAAGGAAYLVNRTIKGNQGRCIQRGSWYGSLIYRFCVENMQWRLRSIAGQQCSRWHRLLEDQPRTLASWRLTCCSRAVGIWPENWRMRKAMALPLDDGAGVMIDGPK